MSSSLPQQFADEFGWPEMVAQVVVRSAPESVSSRDKRANRQVETRHPLEVGLGS